jgi:hypothetical protein
MKNTKPSKSSILAVPRKRAIRTYNELDGPGKEKMQALFGKKALGITTPKRTTPLNITERATSYKNVCKIIKVNPLKDRPYTNPRNIRQEYFNQIFVIDNITECLCEGKALTFADKNQEKWFPVFIWDEQKKGFVFLSANYDYTRTDAGLSPRLCFPTKELATFAGKTFTGEYDKLLKFNHAIK